MGLLGGSHALISLIAYKPRLSLELQFTWCRFWCYYYGMSFIPKFELRRAYEGEKPLLKRTAKALATRYDTDSPWIEKILNNTLFRSKSLLDLTTAYGKKLYETDDDVLSDNHLYSQFMPSVLELLAVLGATRTKKLLNLKIEEILQTEYTVTGKERIDAYDEPLTKNEMEALKTVSLNRFLIDIFFNIIPPPINRTEAKDNEEDESDDEEETHDQDHASLLADFKAHLIIQKEEIIKGSGRAYAPFTPYPWFDKAFATGANVETIVLCKGMLVRQSTTKGTRTDRFIKNEKERAEFSSKDQSAIAIIQDNSIPLKFESSLNLKASIQEKKDLKKYLSDSDSKKQELNIREKLFKLRIEAIDLITEYLAGTLTKEPVDAIAERMSDLFSRDEAQAILGRNPKYFNLPDDTEYKHRDESIFHRILRTATFLPAIETTYIRKLIRDSKPIFDYSLDIQGAHEFSFSYIELMNLVQFAQLEQLIPTLELVVQRFSALEKRAYASFLKALRLDRSMRLSDPVKSELDIFAKKIADRTDVVIPYLKDILEPSLNKQTKRKVGLFTEGFREYHPVNKKIGVIRFTSQQSKVIEALYEAHELAIKGEVKRLTLVDKIYSVEEANDIRLRHGKHVTKKDGSLSRFKYEWRLEKTILKEDHPAWKLGLVKLGEKIGDDKSYKLDLYFEYSLNM